MAGKCQSGRYGSYRGSNYGCKQAVKEPSGCFGVLAFLIVGAAGLFAVASQVLVQWGS